jgi:hypothetical protein
MAKKLVIGIAYARELNSPFGHVACTLGGVNYESRGDRGILKGSAARGANSRPFRHRFYVVLSDAAAMRAKQYADAHIGEPYVLYGVPGNGGDCSGFVSGIICAARGRPIQRVFSTSNWAAVYQRLGFKPGTGPSPAEEADDMDENTIISQAKDVVIGPLKGGTLKKPLNWWLSAIYSHIIGLEAFVHATAKAVTSIDGVDDQVKAQVKAAGKDLADIKSALQSQTPPTSPSG